MLDKSTEVKHKVMRFAIREDEEIELLEAYLSIDELIQEDKEVPADLIKTFLSFLHDPTMLYKEKFEAKTVAAVEKYELRFSTENPAFMFDSEIEIDDPNALGPMPGERRSKKGWKPPKVKIRYSWKEMVTEISSNYLNECVTNEKLHIDTRETIMYLTRQLNDYLKKAPKEIQLSLILTYRQAITAFLCEKITGLKATAKKQPTVNDLAEGARYYFNLEMKKKQRVLTSTEILLSYGKSFKTIMRNGKK